MDVLDAGVYVAKWEASVPAGVQPVLWGPLQAREMGLDGWQWQDGGETGFVAHNPHVRLPAGFGTSTLIVVNRLRRAFLTVYFGGYPADAPRSQRRLDAQKIAGACEMFLGRLAREEVRFEFQGELALVDNTPDSEAGPATHMLPRRLARGEAAADAGAAPRRQEEVRPQADADPQAQPGGNDRQGREERPIRPRARGEVWEV